MTSPEDFTPYARLADVARLQALNIGYYHEKFGDVPQEELLGMVRSETFSDESKRLLLHGMQNLVSALAEVMGVAVEGGEDAVH